MVPGQFDFPIIAFNNNHSYPTATNSTSDHNIITYARDPTAPISNKLLTTDSIIQRNVNIAQMINVMDALGSGAYFITTFEIDLVWNGSTGTIRQLSCDGTYNQIVKAISNGAYQYTRGIYNRIADIGGTSLTHISFGSFTQYSTTNGMSFCELNLEVVPLAGTFSVQTS